jgi:acetyl esterase
MLSTQMMAIAFARAAQFLLPIVLTGCAHAPAIVASAPLPPRVIEIRALTKLAAEKAAADKPAPAVPTSEQRIAGPAGPLRLVIYRGTNRGNAPAILSVHGGAWIAGGNATHDLIQRKMALDLGAVVIGIDYRLAPEHPYPAAVEDTGAALAWLFANTARLQIDRDRVAIVGDSSGGNLAAVIAAKHRDRGGHKLAALVLVNPVMNIASLDTDSYRRIGAKPMEEYVGFYVPPGTDLSNPDLSPALQPNLRELPPTLVISAENDALRDEDEAYAARLRAAGAPVTQFRQNGVGHFGMRWATADPSINAALATSFQFLGQRLRK